MRNLELVLLQKLLLPLLQHRDLASPVKNLLQMCVSDVPHYVKQYYVYLLSASSWDFSFIFIALISIIGLLVIACGIVCTLKKCNLGLLPQTPDNCPDTSFGMLELSRMPNRSQENTYIVHPPCQRPERPTDFLVGPPHLSPSWTRTRPAQNTQSTGERQRPQTSYSPTPAPSNSIRMPKQSPLLSPSETEAPPPSYHDIFPPDYVPDAAVMRGEQNATEI